MHAAPPRLPFACPPLPLFQKEPFHGREVQLFHIIIIYRIHAAKLIFSVHARTFIPPQSIKLSNCQTSRCRIAPFGHKGRHERENAILAEREECTTPTVCLLPLTFCPSGCQSVRTGKRHSSTRQGISMTSCFPFFVLRKPPISIQKGILHMFVCRFHPVRTPSCAVFRKVLRRKKVFFQPNEK